GERALIDRAVYSTIQLRRCARFHAATVADQVRDAQERCAHAQEDEITRLEALLETDPATAVRDLKRSAFGCRWLLDEWAPLVEVLDKPAVWSTPERDRAIRLSGSDPDKVREDPNCFMFR